LPTAAKLNEQAKNTGNKCQRKNLNISDYSAYRGIIKVNLFFLHQSSGEKKLAEVSKQ